MNREHAISEMLNELDNTDTAYTTMLKTECIPTWLKRNIRSDRRRVRKAMKQASDCGIIV